MELHLYSYCNYMELTVFGGGGVERDITTKLSWLRLPDGKGRGETIEDKENVIWISYTFQLKGILAFMHSLWSQPHTRTTHSCGQSSCVCAQIDSWALALQLIHLCWLHLCCQAENTMYVTCSLSLQNKNWLVFAFLHSLTEIQYFFFCPGNQYCIKTQPL